MRGRVELVLTSIALILLYGLSWQIAQADGVTPGSGWTCGGDDTNCVGDT